MTFDTIIVGAGPAGSACAIWLKQLGFEPILVDKNDRAGGLQLLNPYTNTWIASSANAMGSDVVNALNSNLDRHGVRRKFGVGATAARIDGDQVKVGLSSGEELRGSFLVLAGGSSPKAGGFVARMGILVGPGTAVANTDFANARVAILGGGDNALENYHFAKQRGATYAKVFSRSPMKACVDALQRADLDDLIVGPYEVNADSKTVNGEPFDIILVLYGYEAHPAALLGLSPARRPDGFVFTDSNCQTSIDRVYAIGELAQRSHPCCTTAMADGVVAAKAIQAHLEASKRAQLMGATKRMSKFLLTLAA